jgi:hypothetical protein
MLEDLLIGLMANQFADLANRGPNIENLGHTEKHSYSQL